MARVLRAEARWREGDDGVVLVEMALVLPVLVVLLLGTFTGALAWNQSQALGSGARIAARQAATLPLPVPSAGQTQAQANEAWLDGVLDDAIEGAEGQLGAGVPARVACVALVDPAGASPDRTTSRRLEGTTRTSGTTPCFEDGQPDTLQRVQVLLSRGSHIDTGFHRFPITIRRTAVFRFEASDGL